MCSGISHFVHQSVIAGASHYLVAAEQRPLAIGTQAVAQSSWAAVVQNTWCMLAIAMVASWMPVAQSSSQMPLPIVSSSVHCVPGEGERQELGRAPPDHPETQVPSGLGMIVTHAGLHHKLGATM